ncbi:hypothetical protein HMPREF9555_01476 [Selenomonas artemidis F0399]|uniref:Uncharacterized protein n=1 Tax=Selenomonas artemidis F0399 TaxID=749551 RepID=E7N3A1_9FIRM|nr:hypothetical protein HMPREF9555_01476 [Selenomonas artemidis F0399]
MAQIEKDNNLSKTMRDYFTELNTMIFTKKVLTSLFIFSTSLRSIRKVRQKFLLKPVFVIPYLTFFSYIFNDRTWQQLFYSILQHMVKVLHLKPPNARYIFV